MLNHMPELIKECALKSLLLSFILLSILAEAQADRNVSDWNKSIDTGNFFEVSSTIVTKNNMNFEVVCKSPKVSEISADQESVECSLFKADRSKLIAQLNLPYTHDLSSVKYSEEGKVTIEVSSDKCSHVVIYELGDIDFDAVDEVQHWPFEILEQDCWR